MFRGSEDLKQEEQQRLAFDGPLFLDSALRSGSGFLIRSPVQQRPSRTSAHPLLSSHLIPRSNRLPNQLQNFKPSLSLARTVTSSASNRHSIWSKRNPLQLSISFELIYCLRVGMNFCNASTITRWSSVCQQPKPKSESVVCEVELDLERRRGRKS